MENTHSNSAFKFAMIALGAILVGFALGMLSHYFKLKILFSLGVLLSVSSFPIAFVGFIVSFRSLREPNTAKKIIALIINLSAPAIVIAIIVANTLDVIRAFS